MESFRDLVESMENDLKDDGKPRRFRPKVEKDEENNSPVSGLSGNRVQHESAMEDGGRRKVKIELRADLERARWEKEEEEGRAVGGSEARGEKKREMFMRGQDTAPPWLKEKQSGSVYDQQELPPPERLLDQQDTPPERVKSKAKDPQLKRHSRGRARTSGYKSTFSTPGPGEPAAPDPMPAPPGDEWPSVSPSRGPRPSKGISGAVAEDIGAGAAFSLGGEHPETLFRCHLCHASARDAGSLARHCRRHNPTRPFGCGLCPSRFNQLVHLQIHQRTHTGEKPFCCDVCSARFSRKDRLRSHQRTHTGEKPYTCPYCDAAHFRDTVGLKAHLRTHAGEKPFACRVCRASFVNLTTFTTHCRMHSMNGEN